MITNEIICFQKFYNDFEVQKPVDKHRIQSISIVKLSFSMCFNNLLQGPNALVGILLKNGVSLNKIAYNYQVQKYFLRFMLAENY